jgi:hypothetical protein
MTRSRFWKVRFELHVCFGLPVDRRAGRRLRRIVVFLPPLASPCEP